MTTEVDHLPIWGRLEQWLQAVTSALQHLASALRPLSGHVNVHSLPSDRIAFATYSLVNTGSLMPMPIQTGMAKGVACRVTLRLSAASIGQLAIANAPDLAIGDTTNAFLLSPTDGPLMLFTRDDLWLWGDVGTIATVSVAIESFEAMS